MSTTYTPNAALDLSFERLADVARAQIWRAWTEPALLMRWFCPAPWTTVACEIDLRAGGRFFTTMQSPQGQQLPNTGCFLEVVPGERLVWTNALLPGFRPNVVAQTCGSADADFMFSAIIEMADDAAGTRYRATVVHADVVGAQKHAAMGFEAGWGAAFEQMVVMIKQGI